MTTTDKKIQNKTAKLNKKIGLRNIIIALLILWLPLSIAGLTLQKFWLKSVSKDLNETYEKSFRASESSLGFACGLLTGSKVSGYLGERNLEKIVNITPSVFYGLHTQVGRTSVENGNSEGCYYQAKENSEKRVSLLVVSFSNDYEAKKMFEFYLSGGENDAREIPEANNDGRRLIYSNAGYSRLYKNRIYTVGASNGKPSENDSFTKPIFEQLMREIQL